MDEELSSALDILRETTEASAVRLIRTSGGDCGAGCDTGLQGPKALLYTTHNGCSSLAQGHASLLIPTQHQQDSDTTILFCVPCELSTGETLALQLLFPDTSVATASCQHRLANLCLPPLMWAKGELEGKVWEARLGMAEKRHLADFRAAIRAQEDEREWLTLEIHDRVAQTLATVFQQLQTLESLTRPSPAIHQVAVRGSMLCQQAIREARDLMKNLRPPILEELGVVPLVEEELRNLQQELGWRVRSKLASKTQLSREAEMALYRIFHEAVVNIQKHANASEVALFLECEQNGVRLRVEDNGLGFDVREALAKRRVGGLISMQRRAELVGGICRLESNPGKGTRINAWLPRAEPTTTGGEDERGHKGTESTVGR